MESRNSYSRYDTHITFFMAGVCCMIINSVVDLESLVLLRFLGNSSYDAQTITFFLRRFNLLIGIFISCLAIFFDVNVRCSDWHWMLFILYFLTTFYIYLLSNNVLTISKYGIAPVFAISLVSHGLLVSTIVYIFEGVHVKYDKNVALCLMIFFCGCFSSGLLVKMLLRFSGDIKDDEHLGLRFYNRLFVLFTVINLVSCFLLSRLTSMDKNYDGSSTGTNKSLHAVLFSRSRWVFLMGCFSWSFSPMFNNFTASVINTLTSMEAFNLEYMQFIICLAFSFALYLLVITDIMTLKVGSRAIRSSETLTEVICNIMNITNETNPNIAIEDGIVEDLVTNDSINIRLFRSLQPWCYLQWGFWTCWENYDSIDNHRILTVMGINMLVSRMRDGFKPVDDVGSSGVGGCTIGINSQGNPIKGPVEGSSDKGATKDLRDEYLAIIDAKYSLTWEITCFIKQCNETLADLPNVFHVCSHKSDCGDGGCGKSECVHHATPESSKKMSGCVLMCLKNVCTSDRMCLNSCLKHAFTDKFVDTNASFYPGASPEEDEEEEGETKDKLVTATNGKDDDDDDDAETQDGYDEEEEEEEDQAPQTKRESPRGIPYGSIVKHGCVACDPSYFLNYKTFVYCILSACISEAQKLLDDIAENPDLDDDFKAKNSNELSLMGIEQFVLRFLGILVYSRVADEFLLLFKQMRHIAFSVTKWTILYLCKHKCTTDCLEDPEPNDNAHADSATAATSQDDPDTKEQNVRRHRCRCLLFLKFIQCVLTLHNKQIQTCKIILGMSRLSLALLLPTLSMTRSLALFSHFFGEFIFSPSIAEHSDCKCGSKSNNCQFHSADEVEMCVQELGRTGQGLNTARSETSNPRCGCGAFSTRVDDLLDMMMAGLSYLSEYDGILSIIIFFYSYLTEFRLDSICDNSNKDVSKGEEIGPECTCCSERSEKAECERGDCKLCLCCLCCPDDHEGEEGEKVGCECPNSLPHSPDRKCCLCSVFCNKCHKSCCSDQVQEVGNGCNKAPEKCCEECSKDCVCCSSSCSNDCCTCCRLRSSCDSSADNCRITTPHRHSTKDNKKPKVLRLSENTKRNMELLTATRRTMVLQSLSDYMLKSNFFKDMYKNLNTSLVNEKLFFLYLAVSLGLYVLCVVGNVVPYVRNVSHMPRLSFLFSLSSVVTAVCILYSFLRMSDFGPDSSLIINLMILISMILCIVWSWTTQWISYRILLYQQFENFYNKFRLVYTGGVNIYEPKLTWWFEGFVSFIKTDFHTMYLIVLLKDFKDNYDPYSFGFTSRLKLNYSLLKSYNTDFIDTSLKASHNEHMVQHRDFVRNIERHLLDPHNLGKDVNMYDLLDYRAFQLIPTDSYHFLTDLNSFEKMTYSVDMIYAAWNKNVKMTRLAERLQFLREGALKTVEELVQNEVKRNNYDRNSIRKLKYYFDFRSEVLADLARNCLHDWIHHGSKLASIQLTTLISIYELEYSKRWSTYFTNLEANKAASYNSDSESIGPENPKKTPPKTKAELEEVEHVPLNSETLLKKFNKWKRRKLRYCDEVYDGSLICKLVVNKAADEFELIVFDQEVLHPLRSFVYLISRHHTTDEVPSDIEVTKYLSHVSKTRDVLELDKVKAEITNLILRDTGNYVGSLIKGYVSVCKSMVQESNMQEFITRNNEIVIGEWIRWQGQHVSSEVIELFSKFTTIEA